MTASFCVKCELAFRLHNDRGEPSWRLEICDDFCLSNLYNIKAHSSQSIFAKFYEWRSSIYDFDCYYLHGCMRVFRVGKRKEGIGFDWIKNIFDICLCMSNRIWKVWLNTTKLIYILQHTYLQPTQGWMLWYVCWSTKKWSTMQLEKM